MRLSLVGQSEDREEISNFKIPKEKIVIHQSAKSFSQETKEKIHKIEKSSKVSQF